MHNEGDRSTQIGYLKIVMRSVVGTHMFAVPWRKVSAENVSLEIHKLVNDFYSCTDESTSQQLAAHKKALAAELKYMGKDLLETTTPRTVTVTYRSIPFPVPATAHT